MLIQVIGTGFVSLISWAVFAFFFHKDRSRYRNCYFLSVALASRAYSKVSVKSVADCDKIERSQEAEYGQEEKQRTE